MCATKLVLACRALNREQQEAEIGADEMQFESGEWNWRPNWICAVVECGLPGGGKRRLLQDIICSCQNGTDRTIHRLMRVFQSGGGGSVDNQEEGEVFE